MHLRKGFKEGLSTEGLIPERVYNWTGKKRPETSCSSTDQPKVLYLQVYNQASKHHN